LGKAFQRPPLRSTQRMPSTTGRLGTGFWPPPGEACGSGSSGASLSQASSVSSGSGISMVAHEAEPVLGLMPRRALKNSSVTRLML
jgi:hypothetical protein